MLNFLVEKYCTLPSLPCIRMLVCKLVTVCTKIASTLIGGKRSYGMCSSFELATQSSIEEEDTLRTALQSRRTVKTKQIVSTKCPLSLFTQCNPCDAVHQSCRHSCGSSKVLMRHSLFTQVYESLVLSAPWAFVVVQVLLNLSTKSIAIM